MVTPILFIVFNRPDTTRVVFEIIRKVKPKHLYLAADGPRLGWLGEKENCEEVREIISNIDWPCKAQKLFRRKNFGCKMAVSSAITWFFENVQEGIILEDDCLPNMSFFKFCEDMLNRYRNDKTTMHVGGINLQDSGNQLSNSYYFSKYSHVWGWATWRRAWRKYDVQMKNWPGDKKSGKLDDLFNSFWEKIYWYTIFDAVYRGKIDTWDYQWLYSIWKNGASSIVPGINLVKNIGFGERATHNTTRKLEIDTKKMGFPLKYLGDHQKEKVFDKHVSSKHFRINLPSVLYQNIKYMFNS